MKNQNSISIHSIDLQRINSDQSKMVRNEQDKRASVSFKNLLENRIGFITQNNILPENLPPIHKNQLTQLAGIIQKQMNEALFHAFSDSKEKSTLHEFQLPGMNLNGLGGPMDHSIPGNENRNISRDIEKTASQSEIESIIEKTSYRYNVDPDLTKAVVRAESDFRPGCTSSKGAMGLMQLMPATARELGVENPYDPDENVDGGTRYLKQLLDRYNGDVNLALSAYNWGMGNVERNPGQLPQETKTYISRVRRYYQEAKTG